MGVSCSGILDCEGIARESSDASLHQNVLLLKTPDLDFGCIFISADR